MQAQFIPIMEAITPRNGVIVLTGYGLRVAVERGHLVLSDGIGRAQRSGTFSRATCGIRRLIVVGHSGTISFEALRWLADIEASFAQVDADGSVIAAFGPTGLDDARLRRAQATAHASGRASDLARYLLRDKLTAQRDLLPHLPEVSGACEALEQALADLESADATIGLRRAEARGAAAYWTAWKDVPVRFAKKDEAKIPAHWRTFGTRGSPLTGQPRLAANPINALLNYSYAILESEGTIACLAVGLDPGIGVLHADQRGRASLTLDVIEPVRPKVDALVLELLRTRVFSMKDFFETREGNCRLMPGITKALGEQAPTMARWLAPVVERMASGFVHGEPKTVMIAARLPTRLTEDNRSAGRDGVRTQPRKEPIKRPTLPTACVGCGVILEDRRLTYCPECREEFKPEQDRANIAAGTAKLAEMRAAGQDPAHGNDAKRKRAETRRENAQLNHEWEASNGSTMTEDEYRDRVLPALAHVPSRAIMAAMSVTQTYALDVRNGRRVPHPRHWTALAAITRPNLNADGSA
jgi:CRISPR-associated endonuclease Cas1